MTIVGTLLDFSAAHPILAGAVGSALAFGVYIVVSTTPKLTRPTLPGPRGWPVVGSLWTRGDNPAETYFQWSKIYGPVFQHRLGNKYCVVVNTADTADELFGSSKYGSSFQSRPISHSFGELLQHDMRTITIGTSPFDHELKAKRRVAIASVGPGVLKNYTYLVDRVCRDVVRDFKNASEANGAVDPIPIMKTNAMNLAISLYLGTDPATIQKEFANVPYNMLRLAQLRNILVHNRDYIPFLQKIQSGGTLLKEAVAVASYRNEALLKLFTDLRTKFEEGSAEPCAGAFVLANHKAGLSEAALTSVANTMVSSGMESHMPNTLLWSLGVLAARPDVQRKCYEAVRRREASGEPVDPEKDHDDYLMAFVKEIGRYYATFRLSLTRETWGKDVVWNGHFIPEGTMVFMNIHAINRDPTRFSEPDVFKPERYMSGPEAERSLPHYAFGIGRRNCPAMLLVHKELYLIFSALLSYYSFSIVSGEREFDPVKSANDGWDFNISPKPYSVAITVRDEAKLEKYLAEGVKV